MYPHVWSVLHRHTNTVLYVLLKPPEKLDSATDRGRLTTRESSHCPWQQPLPRKKAKVEEEVPAPPDQEKSEAVGNKEVQSLPTGTSTVRLIPAHYPSSSSSRALLC